MKYIFHLLGLSVTLLITVIFSLSQVTVSADYRPQLLSTNFLRLNHSHPRPQAVPVNSLEQIALTCQPDCFFQDKLNPDKSTRALTTGNPDGRLQQLQLKFYDPQNSLIGYQDINDFPTFYVIDFQPRLIQAIQLNLNDITKLEFLGYYPDSKQIYFISRSEEGNNYFLYSADSPNLIMPPKI